MDLSSLLPRADLLMAAVGLDILLGDPVYRWHPIRLMGRSLNWCEDRLRAEGADGRAGGCLLFAALSVVWVGGSSVLLVCLGQMQEVIATAFHLFVLYSLIALGDLLKHGKAVNDAASVGDLAAARHAIKELVGRDPYCMDAAGCRRAAIKSLSENLVDGFISPIFWYVLAGLPGVVLFKVANTMDFMVGYKTERYLYFGWCGTRLDNLMNLVPARLTWLLTVIATVPLSGCSV